MAVVPSLSDYEYCYGDTGFILNDDQAGFAANLPFFDISSIDGLDSPEFRTTTRDHEGVDGGYVDAQFMSMRTIVIGGTLYTDPADPETLLDRLKTEYGPQVDPKPFYYKHPGDPVRVAFGKSLGVRYNINNIRTTGKTECQMTIQCPDPYIYDASSILTYGKVFTSSLAGWTFNTGFNMGFGGDVPDPGGAKVTNGGNHRAYPIVTIYGPTSNPTITESQSGKSFTVNMDLASTDYLVIDMRKHQVLLNGTSSRRSAVAPGSKWLYTDPGDSTYFFSGSGSGTGSATAVSAGTTTTLVATDADSADIQIGDRVRLLSSTGLIKDPNVLTVTSKVSSGGNTTITWDITTASASATGDVLIAGIPIMTVEMRSTWY